VRVISFVNIKKICAMKKINRFQTFRLSAAVVFLIACLPFFPKAQTAVSDTTHEPDPSAVLDVYSKSKGLLVPRLTTAQRDSIQNPAEGLLVYDTDLRKLLYFRNGWRHFSLWQADSSGNLYYNPGKVAIGAGSDTSAFDAVLNISGTAAERAIHSYIITTDSNLVPAYAFEGELNTSCEFDGNFVVSTYRSGDPEGISLGMGSFFEGNANTSVAMAGVAYYTGTGGTGLSDIKHLPTVAGFFTDIQIEDASSYVTAIGTAGLANYDHRGINAGLMSEAASSTTYANLGALLTVNAQSYGRVLEQIYDSMGGSRFTAAAVLYNDDATANDYNLFSFGTGKNYFAGSVGIGTVAPQAKLHIAGDVVAEEVTASVATVNDTLKIPTGASEGYVLTSDENGAARWKEPLTYHRRISLSSSQIQNIYSSPVELVPAPGSGKMIVPLKITYKYNFGTTAYTQSGLKGFSIGFQSNTDAAVQQQSGIFGFTSNCYLNLPVFTSPLPPAVDTHFYENEALKIFGIVANPTGGNGTAEVEVFYMIVPY